MVGLLWPAWATATTTTAIGLDELLYRSGLIFSGTVTEVDVKAGIDGPLARTRVVFRLDTVYRGSFDRSHLELSLPEGVMADGRLLETVETPKWSAGERYLVFLRSGPWALSPVVDDRQGSLRLLTVDGRKVATTGSGHCVVDLSRERLSFGPRVAARTQWPGFPQTGGSTPIRPDYAEACLPAPELTRRLDQRLAELGLDDRQRADLRFAPRTDLGPIGGTRGSVQP